MGFGFVVARFGLFLRQLEAVQSGSPVQTTAFSVILGTALIAGGVAVTTLSSFQYVRRVRELREGIPTPGTPSKLALAVALALSVAGLAMAIYLSTQSTPPLPNTLEKKSQAVESIP